jgi:2-polyprenyl-6-hydroxyphenyl methylase/3-demethylubiquinone-9 3-methyltransferase
MSSVDADRSGSLTDPDYWAPYWKNIRLPRTIASNDWVSQELARKIKGYARLGPGARALEVGCSASAWLPFFQQEWGWRVEGIDYTKSGAVTARRNLELLNVPGTIYEADVFDFAPAHAGRYDLVFSFGVVEHFTEPVEILHTMYDLLRPGGRVVVIVPHLRGLGGWLQQYVSQEILDHHNPLQPVDLRRELTVAGFQQIAAGYVGREPLRVLNSPIRDTLPGPMFNATIQIREYLDKAVAQISKALRIPRRWMATYVLACGTKPSIRCDALPLSAEQTP